jgi:hypothetical protein
VSPRFVIRPDQEGYSVIDLWTGAAAAVAMTVQRGLQKTDAAHIAELLNQRAAAGGRSGLSEPRPRTR